MNECPECGNVLRGKKCACGYSPSFEKEGEKGNSETLRCQWISQRGRCGLIGVVGGRGRFYCTWHHECLNDPRSSEDYQEFRNYFSRYDGKDYDEEKSKKRFEISLGF